MTEVLALLFTLAVVVASSVLIAVKLSEALNNALSTLDRIDQRRVDELNSVLDRLMARDFQEFKVYDLGEGLEGGVEEVTEEEIVRGRPWLRNHQPPISTEEQFDPEEEGLPQ